MSAQGANPVNPREVFDRAMAMPDLSPDELSRFRSQLAAVAAQDDAKRAAATPQIPLDLAA